MPLKLGKIHQGDCLKLMQQIDDGSVDLAFADPPFNIGYKYDKYHDRQDDQDYLDWCQAWIGELHRMLKPSGTFWLAIGDEYAAELKWLATRTLREKFDRPNFIMRSWVVWYYTFGVNCTRKFNRSHAHLFQFVKDEKQFTFNAEDPLVRVPSARALVYGDSRANPDGPAAGRHLGAAAAGRARGVPADGRHVVLLARRRHVQGTARLPRLPDAGAAAGPHHPRQLERGRRGVRPLHRQRHDARRGEEARPAVSRHGAVRGLREVRHGAAGCSSNRRPARRPRRPGVELAEHGVWCSTRQWKAAKSVSCQRSSFGSH